MSFIKSIAKLFSWRRPLAIPQLETTEYRITTNTNEYLGVIIQQDDYSIKFQSQENKTVKILKSNINRMSAVSYKVQASNQMSRQQKSRPA